MLYRYLSILFLVLLLGACKEVSSSGRYPKDMPPLSEFKPVQMGNSECGFVLLLKKVRIVKNPNEKITSEEWVAYYKDKDSNPFQIAHAFYFDVILARVDVYVYRNSTTGSATEQFIDDEAAYKRKYPYACQAAGNYQGKNNSR